jgi:hypothetical protein
LGAAERRGHGGIYIQAIQAGGAPSPANERPAPSPPQLVLEIPIYLYYTKSCNIYTSGIADAPTKSHRVVFLRVIHLQLATFRHLYPRTLSLPRQALYGARCSLPEARSSGNHYGTGALSGFISLRLLTRALPQTKEEPQRGRKSPRLTVPREGHSRTSWLH